MSSDPVPFADSLRSVVRSLRNDSESAANAGALGGVFGRWEEAVGAPVAEHVQPVKLDGGKLVVEVDDPAWATQLRFLDSTEKRRLLEVAGATIETIDVRVKRR